MARVIIDRLTLQDGVLSCNDRTGKPHPVFKKQGDLDGACATYSVIMSLLMLGVIYDHDTQVYSKPKDWHTRRLINTFLCYNGMHHQGQSFIKIRKMLLESFGSKVSCTRRATTNEASVDVITEILDSGLPVVMSVIWPGGGHAMVAVGYEHVGGEVTRILCLDPSGKVPANRHWNAEVRLDTGSSNSKYKYLYSNGVGDDLDVSLDDLLIIDRLKSHISAEK